ncbi:hypothetical protein FAES_0552 [Fibrella aestuarina BUZ 2]|uniref:Uncharacterized protein n=1 Tax=Fibrella aestuarina BUZ 2 TaxID=1166018 RepID=I0K360_9BACT|nr:hypothetical protein [Fibrella aestuarina]CCG98563.1 hypothetical protein FAES_0552 [Fibrella aestuarina BUZ 2]
MKNPFFYVLLLVLVLLDGWLMSHPNLLGRAGIFFYDYNYLKTFPRALGTVAAVVGLAVLLAWVGSRAGRAVSLALLLMLLVLSGYWFAISVGQFNSGVYKLTGAGFRAGAILLPGLVVLVFGKGLYDTLTQRR